MLDVLHLADNFWGTMMSDQKQMWDRKVLATFEHIFFFLASQVPQLFRVADAARASFTGSGVPLHRGAEEPRGGSRKHLQAVGAQPKTRTRAAGR